MVALPVSVVLPVSFPLLLIAGEAAGGHQLESAETLITVGRFLVIFLAARCSAELMVRLRLPTILGELVAGILIGLSGLHLILPPETQAELSGWFVGLLGSLADVGPGVVRDLYDETFPSLQAVGTLGLFALLFLTGLECELDELMAVGLQAGGVALTGVALPLALGTLGLLWVFHVPLLAAVFAGATMTATSIGITASVFSELQVLRRREGQIVIGAAVLDDIFGIVLLAVVVSLAAEGQVALFPVLRLVVAALVFVVVSLLLSRRAAPLFDAVLDWLQAPGDVVVAAFVVLCLSCFAAQALGLEAALGAFAAGLILSNSKYTHAIDEAIKPLVALFATVFFVVIGTTMDLSVLNPLEPANRLGLVLALFLLTVAALTKLASGWAYRSAEPTNRLVVGLGMMPRGEVGLIFLGLGAQAGVLNASLEAGILIMVIGTTFLAPVLLRLVLGGQPVEPVAASP